MTLANSDLADRFADGETSGAANRMEIKELSEIPTDPDVDLPSGATVVVGYGWAIYAVRYPDTEEAREYGRQPGEILVFGGWREWADERGHDHGGGAATKRHIRLLSRRADAESDLTPQAAPMPAALVRDLETEPRRGGPVFTSPRGSKTTNAAPALGHGGDD